LSGAQWAVAPTGALSRLGRRDNRRGGLRKDDLMEELRYLGLAAQREGNRILTEGVQPQGPTMAQAVALWVLHEWEPLALIELGSLLVCEQGTPAAQWRA
jgi:hypothetical protein